MQRFNFYQILGYAGTIPFWAFTIALWGGFTPLEPVSLFLYLAAYSGFILSFLGGVHWAHALPRAHHIQMSLAMLPTIFALGVLFLPPLVGGFGIPLLVLAVCFGGLYGLDKVFLEEKWLPAGYFKFRIVLTSLVSLSLVVSAAYFFI